MSDRPQQPKRAYPEFLEGGGEAGALMRSIDWSRTPVGPVSRWPQSLRTAVSICLNSGFPIIVFWGPEMVHFYNDAYRPITGDKHPGLMGKPAREGWADVWHVIGPMLESVLQTGEAVYFEDQLMYPERHGFPEEAYFTFSFSPIRDETGGVGGIFTAVTETTRKVIGERRLRTLRDLAVGTGEARTPEDAGKLAVRALATNPTDLPFVLLYLLDEDGRQARLAGAAGIDAGTLPSMAAADLKTAAADSPWPLGSVLRTGQAAQVDGLEARLAGSGADEAAAVARSALVLPVARSGQDRPYGLLVAGTSPHQALDEDYRDFLGLVAGHIATAIGNARAYEEERARAEAFAELDRAKTTFFSNVSHEFRTPLTLMLGPVEEALERVGEDPEVQRERLRMVHRNGMRLLRLVNTLLDFSSIEAGRHQALFEPTDLARFTADLASNFRSLLERADLALEVDAPPLPEAVHVDRGMWEKIVLNLLSNAFKHTFQGAIRVTVRAAGDHAALEVRDTGIGIPAEELPHLFQRFHRVRGARGRTFEGTGIGLSLVQELVNLHGGRVEVESAPGEGSAFRVLVPFGAAHLPAEHVSTDRLPEPTASGAQPFVEEALRWLEDTEASEEPALRSAPPASAGPLEAPRPRVLLADDNADMREYVRRLLAEQHDVTALPDAAAVLEALRAEGADLVLMDVMMPGMSGLDFLRIVRDDPRTRTTPVILLSARAGEEARVEGLEAGADDYLVKPFSARELKARTWSVLNSARARKELERQKTEDEIRRVNAQLEARVGERTAQLEAALRELEAFSYSVSHDLRAPLRSISGFSQALLEDYGSELDEAARGYLERIEAGTARMRDLIEALLGLAQVSREPLHRRHVDLTALAADLVEDLRGREPERKVEVVLQEGVEALGDRKLLEVALVNLLSNAWKFTRGRDPARIEFGAARPEQGGAYFVRDDGAGFDMRHAERLFAPFQRLHHRGDFEGNGIGLATVQRIIHRHGGRVWAESEPGAGATFFFTLPS